MLLRSVVCLLTLLLIPSVALAEKRLALVISNAAYPSEIGKLENPHKDSAVIAAALEAVGFEKGDIVVLKDVDQPYDAAGCGGVYRAHREGGLGCGCISLLFGARGR